MSTVHFKNSRSLLLGERSAPRTARVDSRVVPFSLAPMAWWTMCVAAMIAGATSSYLAWASITSSPVAGCSGASLFDCGHVLHSRWSSVMSIPVSIPAIATHALILAMLMWQPVSTGLRRLRVSAIGFAAIAAGTAALWFIGLQVFWIQQLCPYCLLAHTAGLVLAITFLVARPVLKPHLAKIGLASAASVAVMIGLQMTNEAPQTYEVIRYPESSAIGDGAPTSESVAPVDEDGTLFEAPVDANRQARQFTQQAASIVAALVNPATLIHGQVTAESQPKHSARLLNNIKLDTASWPLLGQPDAELVFVELFDYTCPHCQKTHESLDAARRQFGDRLAVLTLPLPLDGKCNPTVAQTNAMHREACDLAKLAIAVWGVDRDQFAEFHDYLFDSKTNYAGAMAKARSMVDAKKLDEMLSGSMPSDYIAKHVALYQKAGAGTIPKLLFPSTTIVGSVESGQAMTSLIQQHLERVQR